MIIRESVEEFTKLIEGANKIGIVSHRSPDLDAVCSMLSTLLTLRSSYLDKEIKAYSDDKISNSSFVYDSNLISPKGEEHLDLLISLDSSDIDRVSIPKGLTYKNIVNIDHHVTNTNFGDCNIVIDSSSTCEILSFLFEAMRLSLSTRSAKYLYIGIMSDTGHFAWNVRSSTFKALSSLREKNINSDALSRNFYSYSFNYSKLLGYSFMNSTLEDGILYLYLNKDIPEYSNSDDKSGVSDFLKSVKEAKLVIVIRDNPEKDYEEDIRSVSMRSENIDVSKIALAFGGGGHKKAAGFRSKLKAEDIFKKIKDIII